MTAKCSQQTVARDELLFSNEAEWWSNSINEKRFVNPLIGFADLTATTIALDDHRVRSAWRQSVLGLLLYNLAAKKFLDFPKPTNPIVDERLPVLSSDGRFVAFVSNARGGMGLTDIYLCDLKEKAVEALPEMNSKHMDLQPSLSGDGWLVAFSSDRPGGVGGRDIFLFDRIEKKFLPLPGLNSSVPEQSPSLSADGRFVAFVSERIDGAGERDVYLYDRTTQSLVPTPGLNSKEDDYDSCVVVLQASK